MADQTVTVRPNGTNALGNWTATGGTAHVVLTDNLDTTFVQNTNRCTRDDQQLKLAIADVSLPTGCKITSLRASARCGTITGGVKQPQCFLWFFQTIFIDAITLQIPKLIFDLFSWNCPRPPPSAPSTTWVLQQLEYRTTDVNGQELTQAAVNAYEVRLGRNDAGTNLKISEVYVDVTYNERPVGTATGPTGTITVTTRPAVTWTYTDPESDPQDSYWVRIFSSAQYGAGGFNPLKSPAIADSGWLKGTDLTWTSDVDLPNDSYRAYVQVAQVFPGRSQHVGLQTFVSFTQNVPGPGNPSVTATPEDDIFSRVRVEVTAGATPATETYNMLYSDNSGLDWAILRDGLQIPIAPLGTTVIYDDEAPLYRARWYKVQAFRTLGSIRVGSGYSTTAMATPRNKNFLLKDPKAPTLDMILPIGVKGDKPSWTKDQGIFQPVVSLESGRIANAVVVNGPMSGRKGIWDLVFAAEDQSNWDAFWAINASGRALLWQLPTGEQYYISIGETLDVGDYDIDFGRVEADDPEVMYRVATVSYVQVDRPD